MPEPGNNRRQSTSSDLWPTALRLKYLRIATAAAYLGGMLFSWRLWFGVGRSVPRLPLLNLAPHVFADTEYLLTVLLAVALAASLCSSRLRYLLASVVLTLALVFLDLTRLQPWVYQYTLMITTLAFASGRESSESKASADFILAANQIIVAALYFWSGVQKMNWTFVHQVFPGLFTPAGIHLAAGVVDKLPAIAFGAAAFESLIGIALLVRKSRRLAIVLAIAMHVLVLGLLILSHQNSVVWPWNLAMTIFMILLFGNSAASPASKAWAWSTASLANQLPKLVVLACVIAPALSFIGHWDLYLSGALYSGNAPVAVAHIDEPIRNSLSVPAQQTIFKSSRGESMLPFYEWSMAELNVPPYPEMRAYRQLARILCTFSVNLDETELIVRGRPAIADGSFAVSRTSCRDLLR